MRHEKVTRKATGRYRSYKPKNVSPYMIRAYMPRPARLERATYGLERSRAESTTTLDPTSYQPRQNHLTANLTENDDKIQHDLAQIINRWTSLPANIQAAIMVLIGGGEDE